MSLSDFARRLERLRLSEAENKWFPKWLEGYAQHCQSEPAQRLPVREDLVIGFLRSLRDNRVAAWRRLQAARAIEAYQRSVLGTETFDFHPIKLKLGEIARNEQFDDNGASKSSTPVPGEGNIGVIDADEPEVVRKMRGRLRVLHHPKSTEDCYIGWIERLIRHLDDERLERYGEAEIADFLTELALTREVAAGTQNQALSACLFLLSSDDWFARRATTRIPGQLQC